MTIVKTGNNKKEVKMKLLVVTHALQQMLEKWIQLLGLSPGAFNQLPFLA